MTNQTTIAANQTNSSQLACDINAGFAFFLDVVVNIFVLSGLLIGVFDFPAEIAFGKIVPGAIIAIFVGNAAMFMLTKSTEKRTGNTNLTSIPLGLDLPTIFGMVFFIVGPAYAMNVGELGATAAGDYAWKIGIACTLWMGAFKMIFSYFGAQIQNNLPQMALVGAMAGIATVWLGAEAILGVFELPEVGILSLVIMLYALTAGHKLPFAMPGAVIAILLSSILFYVFAFAGYGGGYVVNDMPAIIPVLPIPTLAGFDVLTDQSLAYIGLVLPFALLISASGINVTAGANMVGDQFKTGEVLRLDAATTIITALFGGIVQSTPYFGHPTYKRMGAKTHYALGATAVITIGGLLGLIAFASQLIPSAVLKPILVVVACDIIRLGFVGGDPRHAPAFLFSLVPGILNYAFNKLDQTFSTVKAGIAGTSVKLSSVLGADWMASFTVLGALSRGYILTSMLWATLVIWIIDKRTKEAAFIAFLCAFATLFGVIHSVLPSSEMYLPWTLSSDLGAVALLPFKLASGYAIAGVVLLLLAMTDKGEAQEASESS